MQKLFLLFLLSGFTAFSFSQTSNKNDCDFDNIVTSDVVVSKYNRNPKKFKYVYTFNNSFNTNNNFRLNVDSYVCNYMSKNYKKIGFKKGEDYYKIKSFNVNDPNNTNDFYDCVELNDQTVFTNNLCIVEDLNQYANTTSLTTTSTTSTTTTTTTSTTFPTTITLNEPVSNNTTTHETTTSDSNSVSTTDSTPTSNLNVNSEPPETSESKQEDTNKAMVGMAVGTALGVTLFIVLVIILVSHLKKRRYNVNNTNTNTNNLNTNNSNEDHKNNEYVEPTDSLYLEPISHNPEYKSTENGENEGVYYPNEPLSPVVEKNEIEHNYEYDYASPEHSPVYDNPTGNYSNVYESDE